MKPEDLLTTPKTCEALGITRPTLYAWIRQGKINPWAKLGGHSAWFFLKDEVEKAKGRRYQRIGS
ncbi:MAG: helix-turn-helix domain-containing protein [Elusimicrobiota bacterium]|jgi:excisionase family DNA binding protein